MPRRRVLTARRQELRRSRGAETFEQGLDVLRGEHGHGEHALGEQFLHGVSVGPRPGGGARGHPAVSTTGDIVEDPATSAACSGALCCVGQTAVIRLKPELNDPSDVQPTCYSANRPSTGSMSSGPLFLTLPTAEATSRRFQPLATS